MEQQRVDLFMATNSKYFAADKIFLIKERLEKMDDDRMIVLASIEYKDPNTMLLISIFAGVLGLDRFLIGDMGMGILKLFTGGLCGILTVIDWFLISNKAREYNFRKFVELA